MALPQQAIERLVRARAETPGAYQNLLMLTSTIFFVILLLYSGLSFGYTPYLERQSADLDARIRQFGEQVSGQEQEELRSFYSQLANLKTLLSEHSISSPVFSFLEKNTLPSVYYTRARLDAVLGEMVLEGVAPGMDDIASQVALFERAPEVLRVNMRSISKAGESIQRFNVTVYFAPESFREFARR